MLKGSYDHISKKMLPYKFLNNDYWVTYDQFSRESELHLGVLTKSLNMKATSSPTIE